jgi:hypothetical protein
MKINRTTATAKMFLLAAVLLSSATFAQGNPQKPDRFKSFESKIKAAKEIPVPDGNYEWTSLIAPPPVFCPNDFKPSAVDPILRGLKHANLYVTVPKEDQFHRDISPLLTRENFLKEFEAVMNHALAAAMSPPGECRPASTLVLNSLEEEPGCIDSTTPEEAEYCSSITVRGNIDNPRSLTLHVIVTFEFKTVSALTNKLGLKPKAVEIQTVLSRPSCNPIETNNIESHKVTIESLDQASVSRNVENLMNLVSNDLRGLQTSHKPYFSCK